MVISCDRGGGGEQQLVSALEVEEVMILLHLYSLPQTVSTSNGSDRGTKRVGQRWRGGCRDWSPFNTPVVEEKWPKLSEVELFNCAREGHDIGIFQDVKQDLSCATVHVIWTLLVVKHFHRG